MDLITQRLKLIDINPDKAREIAAEKEVDADSIELLRKGFTASDVEFIEGERAAISWITTNAIDADREIIDPDGAILDRYNKNRVVLWCHRYDELPIGDSMWIKKDPTGKGLISKTRYAKHAKAEEIYQYRKEGFPLAQSIGFIPIEWIDNPKEHPGCRRKYTKWELLEYSDVPVPNNPEAINIAVSKGLVKKDMINKIMYNNTMSVYDIFNAIYAYWNDDAYRWIADLYPKNYPDGDVIVGTYNNGKYEYFSAAYTIKEGAATLSELVPMKIEYTEKAFAFGKAGRVLSSKNRTLIKSAVQQMDEAGDALRELLTATEPNEPSDEPAGETVEMTATAPAGPAAVTYTEKSEITKTELLEALQDAMNKNRVNIAGIIDETVAKRLGRATL